MKKIILIFVAGTLFVGCFCLHASYQATRTGVVSDIVAKEPTCDFIIATTKLEKPYEEIAILERTGFFGDFAYNVEDFKAAVMKQVCRLGGEAVISEVNGKGA